MIHPLNLKVKTILKVTTSLAVVAFVVFIWASARPVPIQVRVTFAGIKSFTNAGMTIETFPIIETWVRTEAYFRVSNAGKCSVFDEGAYAFDIKNGPRFRNNYVRELKGELKPGEFETVSFAVPGDNPEAWRVSLFFSKAHRRVHWWEELVRNPPLVLRKVLEFVPARWLGHQIEVSSDWIERPELIPITTKTTYTPPTNVVQTDTVHW